MDLQYKIGLTLIPGIGDVTAKKLIAYCGSAEAVFKENKSKLKKIPDIGTVLANSIAAADVLKRSEQEIEFIEKYKISALFFLDKHYPEKLRACQDSPVMIYYKGKADLNTSKVLSIVGTRKATDYGKQMCRNLLEGLADYNTLIVSGLAYGIDIAAHKECLNLNIPTVGILAHGLDKIYPAQHKPVAEKMLEQGGVLTEFLSKAKPDRENFPKRNRIIAGMADATLVVEAGIKGGALITAEIANSYNRDVFAVPGRVTDTYSEGCNYLIRTNKAALVQTASDIEYLMGWQKEDKKRNSKIIQPTIFNLSAEEEVLVNILKEVTHLDIDTLCLQSNLNMSKVAASLLNLEFGGIVKSLPGKRYQLN